MLIQKLWKKVPLKCRNFMKMRFCHMYIYIFLICIRILLKKSEKKLSFLMDFFKTLYKKT